LSQDEYNELIVMRRQVLECDEELSQS
jgi:hypothetical protein